MRRALWLALAVAGWLFGGLTTVAAADPGAFTLNGSAVCANGQAQVSLAWTGSSDAVQYTVYRDGVAIHTVEAGFLSIPGFSMWLPGAFWDLEVGSSQTYRYQVVATNSGPTVTWSNEVTVTTPACVPLTVTIDPPSAELAQGGEATFTATVGGLPEPPQPTSFSIDFDDLETGTVLTNEYLGSVGATFAPASGDPQEYPIVVGPGLPLGNACPGGTSEASSLPNFLAPHSETHLNFGGTGFGGFVVTLTPVQHPSLTLVSVGAATVTITYRRVDGTTSTQTVGPNAGAADGACNKNTTSYAGDELIAAITIQSDAPVGSVDGIGIDDLSFTRPPDGPGDPVLSWSVSDPNLGTVLTQPDATARFVAQPDVTPGLYSRAIIATVFADNRVAIGSADIIIRPPACQLAVDLAASPNSVESGAPITVDWTATDWIAMYPADESNNQNHLQGLWQWVDPSPSRTGGRTSGSLTFTAPAEAGTYVFRYLLGAPPRLDWYTHIAQSNPVTVTAPTPTLVRATIEPPEARLTLRELADGSFVGNPEVPFTGHCLDGSDQEISTATKQWKATLGTVTETGLWTAPRADGTGSVTVTCTLADQAPQVASAPVTVDWIPYVPPPPLTGPAQILGDVYAGGSISNLELDEHSVVSAGGTLTVAGARYQIPGYQRSLAGPIAWSTIQRATDRLLGTLLVERARPLPSSSISGEFNLNPASGDPNDRTPNRANPEGGLWYSPGDLAIGPTTFAGRGTIVVGGSLEISGDGSGRLELAAPTSDLLGVIVLNRTSATPGLRVHGIQALVGAYFLYQGTIRVESANLPGVAPLTLRGLLAGQSLSFDSDRVAAVYDPHLTDTPPLGFAPLVVPTTGEVVP